MGESTFPDGPRAAIEEAERRGISVAELYGVTTFPDGPRAAIEEAERRGISVAELYGVTSHEVLNALARAGRDSTHGPYEPQGARWLLDNTRHMGTTLGQLDNGTVPLYRVHTPRGDVLHEREFLDSGVRPGGTWAGPDAEQLPPPAALVPVCTCGWRGEALPYDPDGGQWQNASGATDHRGQDLDALGAWQEHARAAAAATDPVVPRAYLEQLGEMAGALADLADTRPRAALNVARLMRELADHIEPLALAQARALDVSWDALGSDLGVTRQSVSGRYARPSRELQQRVQDLTGGTVADLLAAVPQRDGGAPPIERDGWTAAVRRILGEHDHKFQEGV
ncbi:hypothetical protein ABZ383_26480 [Streptomyces sp. NPDC005900]|uniref:hypothetical protein n=1 Tax=Streptomyces sp. NPDC005900 TaxID=3154569 RepID=UPI0033D03DED